MRRHSCVLLSVILATGFASFASAADPFTFKDVGESTGLLPAAAGIRGHGAAWGDFDGDGSPDLVVATFHNQGSKSSMLLRNNQGKFELAKQQPAFKSGLGSGALFVDLTNSGKLDLFVSNCAHGKEGITAEPSQLFRNDGGGKFTDISQASGACLPNYSGRGLAALDFDGDGLLDLITCEQYYSPKVKTGPALLRNLGGHKFENVAEKAGLPAGYGGLGVAVGDLNLDGWPDLVFTSGAGEHRVYMSSGKGTFRQAASASDALRWKIDTPDNTPAGVCIGDVNRDGLPDIVIGQHFKTPWTAAAPIRLYLHRGLNESGEPSFEEVTEKCGLIPLPMKAPHVEIQDFDNDGWPDIYVSIVKFKNGQPHPVIFKNLGTASDGGKSALPKFSCDVWSANDFPTEEDRATKRSGPFFEKLLKEKKIIYMAAAPSGDFDRDGRIDLFLANWWNESPSLLLKNETAGGNWLDVRFDLPPDRKPLVNRAGIGARINIYPAGKLGDKTALLASREIAIGQGFCSGQEPIAHFGLGKLDSVDLEIILPHGKGKIEQRKVKGNQRVVLKGET